MQLGFVIDHSRCIGCHACTVACKSENEVPVGSFRTWVKYVEEGEFPSVRRSFAVLRCNQCSNAPCVTICPVSALAKRDDGIVDVDPAACIGCKACMHGCPYDALYINEAKGTAEKCHFCAHRTELGLAPACAVVCPTEAIIPGDFDDPTSRVSRMQSEEPLAARKTEAGTGPNVFYRDASPAGLDPALSNLSHGSIWSERPTGLVADAQLFEAMEGRASARTVYDVPRPQLWGGKIVGYLFFKSIAAGLFPLGALGLAVAGESSRSFALWFALLSLLFLALTGALLVADLKRPARFFYILLRPNWSSWLARGTFIIVAYGLLLTVHAALALVGLADSLAWKILLAPTALAGAMTAAYTAWLFAQAKGRVLWMKRGLALHLIVQAAVAGSAAALLAGTFGLGETALALVERALVASLVAHVAAMLVEGRMAPRRREREYERASAVVTHGPLAAAHWGFGVVLGVCVPLALLALPGVGPFGALAAVLALAGLWVEEDVFVRAGQALPIS